MTQPSSFANGRYQVKEFLGEGGRKRVYSVHDTPLDRSVALAVINTEGSDPTSGTKQDPWRIVTAPGVLGLPSQLGRR